MVADLLGKFDHYQRRADVDSDEVFVLFAKSTSGSSTIAFSRFEFIREGGMLKIRESINHCIHAKNRLSCDNERIRDEPLNATTNK
jgi:hypothetical protein